MASFLFLRDQNTDLRRALARDRRTAASDADIAHFGPPAPALDVIDVTVSDAADMRRDPEYLAVSRAMPTRLIAPEPLDHLRPDDVVPGWGAHATGADRHENRCDDVSIALLDTGIDRTHPAFAETTLEERDFVGTGSRDLNGHGTQLAGIAIGGTETSGMAPGVGRALIGKVLADDGRGDTARFGTGLLWAAREKADVIAFALDLDTDRMIDDVTQKDGMPAALSRAIMLEAYRDTACLFHRLIAMISAGRDGGPLIVAAVGNDSRRTVSPEFIVGPGQPAALRGVMSVGAVGQTDHVLEVAPFSNANPVLCAPGVGIVTADTDAQTRTLNGTSAACAHVAGIGALWAGALRRSGPASGRDIRQAMIRNCVTRPFADGQATSDRGYGLIQAP